MQILMCSGGSVTVPDEHLVLVDREDGGNLIVHPPREVWERRELDPRELTLWSFLVAATGSAMLDVLPQLEGGCINYWEAGNWSLNHDAPPAGPKTAALHRRVHLHLLGRSRFAKSSAMQWGEAPKFPDYRDRHKWAATNKQLSDDERRAVAQRAKSLLVDEYAFHARDILLNGESPSFAAVPTFPRN